MLQDLVVNPDGTVTGTVDVSANDPTSSLLSALNNVDGVTANSNDVGANPGNLGI